MLIEKTNHYFRNNLIIQNSSRASACRLESRCVNKPCLLRRMLNANRCVRRYHDLENIYAENLRVRSISRMMHMMYHFSLLFNI